MGTYDEECLEVFLKMQTQLFREEVASNMEEAEEFLEDCMAVVCENIEDVKEYLEESGMDVAGMSNQEIEEASEVFPLSDHRYLIVEG
ncbi:MAG: glyoxalase [Lachnospiraceae bacterium]